MTNEDFPCSCCGFLVFAGPAGSYEVCPVCDWEDDHVQLAHPSIRCGANPQSLADSQAELLQKIPVTVREQAGVRRDEHWRPLNAAELKVRADAPTEGMSYFKATAEQPRYYWLIEGEP